MILVHHWGRRRVASQEWNQHSESVTTSIANALFLVRLFIFTLIHTTVSKLYCSAAIQQMTDTSHRLPGTNNDYCSIPLFKFLLSYYHTVTLSYCHTVTLSYCHTVILSHCHTVTLSHCLTVLLSYCHTVTLSYCPSVLYITISLHHSTITYA